MYHRQSFIAHRLSAMAWIFALISTAVFTANLAVAQQQGQKTFASAAEATKALVVALKANNETDLLTILGPDGKDIVSSGDSAEDQQHRAEFVKKYHEMHRLVIEPDGNTTLYIGAENWPTPIPLKNVNGKWFFNTPMGKAQILYRRIGRNELAAIQVCRELVDSEKEYYGQSHDGEPPNQYAQKLFSDPGKHNGLYWEASGSEGQSPVGPLLASASTRISAEGKEVEPFMGYYYRVLTAQKGPGGTRSYIVDGKMTRGFAILAYPAEYRSSGVMTFIVDQDGIVYEKDLGRKTPDTAKNLSQYSRDASWRKAD
jgi:DUF2950 family protein